MPNNNDERDFAEEAYNAALMREDADPTADEYADPDPPLPNERPATFDDLKDLDCPQCRPFPCDDPDRHLVHEIPSEYTPLRNMGCHCGADFDGRDCMCFE